MLKKSPEDSLECCTFSDVFHFGSPWLQIRNVNIFMYKNIRYRLQLWTDFHDIHMVGAGPPIGEPYCFINNRPNKTIDMGENVPPKTSFSGLSQPMWGFSRKKLENSIQYPIPPPPQKRLYSFLSYDAPFPQKWSCWSPKIIFRSHFGKYWFFFSKKLWNEKYSKRQCLQKRLH